MVTFDLPSGSGPPKGGYFPCCVKQAVDGSDRDQLIQCLAAYRIIPVKNPWAETGYGKKVAYFQRRGDTKPGSSSHVSGSETQKRMLDLLGIDSTENIEPAREEIKNHPDWGEKA